MDELPSGVVNYSKTCSRCAKVLNEYLEIKTGLKFCSEECIWSTVAAFRYDDNLSNIVDVLTVNNRIRLCPVCEFWSLNPDCGTMCPEPRRCTCKELDYKK